MNTYVYTIYGNIYINLTNFCSNACEFCVRNHESTMDGREFGSHSGEGDYDLWLDREPSYKDVTDILDKMDFSRYKEMVFCGYGEPSARFDLVEMLCVYAHERGIKTRINTNGQGNAILGKDIAPRMCRCIDTINVSLNATDAQSYDRLCHSVYGEKAFDIMLDFAKECVRCGGNVVLSIVDCVPPEQLQKAAEIARDIGAKLRVRKMI
ncbi:MAG TPA: radical SAM protein [Candidatus Caccalectryoclostridium excrementigallinarum]|uniref:Radical SAM protein n=1 Tax=Candidatus Caccalectryoclostridium excrementigallinarum TaxID=2840710 RepID=A0A9D1MMI4_9FIRM|nr:radical SAM protein [Candidatus Caccalectryoclostridium excrementigallinarum]